MADVPNILDYPNAPLIVTGQTTDRTPAGRTSKDDGGEQVGIARKYTVLDTGQYSGTTDITVNAKTDAHTNECVLDNVTGLMWSRREVLSVGPDSNGRLFWDDTGGNNEDVFQYCDKANGASLAGFSDWRIPNIRELYSLTTQEPPNAKPDAVAFPVFVVVNCHSSTTALSANTQNFGTNFTFGSVDIYTKITTKASLLLCRLGYGR